jgi:dihydrofolate reductase
MTITLIAAVAEHRVIGHEGRLPWRIPDDMARFRSITTGHPVIMGRATWDSMRGPLSGRTNIVLTRSDGWSSDGCIAARSADEAVDRARRAPGAEEAFVIGGAVVYALFLPRATRMRITWIDADVPGDALFPEVEWSEWRTTREEKGSDAPLPHRFVDYERIRS